MLIGGPRPGGVIKAIGIFGSHLYCYDTTSPVDPLGLSGWRRLLRFDLAEATSTTMPEGVEKEIEGVWEDMGSTARLSAEDLCELVIDPAHEFAYSVRIGKWRSEDPKRLRIEKYCLKSSPIHHSPSTFPELEDKDLRLNTLVAVYSSNVLLLVENEWVNQFAPILNRLQFVHVNDSCNSGLLVVLPVKVEVQLGSAEEGGGDNMALPRGGPRMLYCYETRVYKAVLVDDDRGETVGGEGSIRLEQIHFPPLPTSYEELVSC